METLLCLDLQANLISILIFIEYIVQFLLDLEGLNW